MGNVTVSNASRLRDFLMNERYIDLGGQEYKVTDVSSRTGEVILDVKYVSRTSLERACHISNKRSRTGTINLGIFLYDAAIGGKESPLPASTKQDENVSIPASAILGLSDGRDFKEGHPQNRD